MAHPKRKKQAEKLKQKLAKGGWTKLTISYDQKDDEWSNGENSLLSYDEDADYHLVIQDDAVISDNLYENCVGLIQHAPYKTIISLYTGTVRPFNREVSTYVERARKEEASFIKTKRVLWGVALLIPTSDIEKIVQFCKDRKELYDTRIGRYYQHMGKPTLLCNPSIVDHDYTLPSLTGHEVEEPRHARYYEPELVKWNSKTILSFLIQPMKLGKIERIKNNERKLRRQII